MKFQYELWLSRWPMVYVMVGICLFGVLCRIIAYFATIHMARQVRRLERGKRLDRRSLTKRMLDAYRKTLKKGIEIEDLEHFVERAVAEARLLGIPVLRLENWNLTAMVACFILGAVGSLTAFLNGSRDSEIVFVFTVGLTLTGVCVLAEVFFHNEYYRLTYMLGMQNYIENEYRYELKKELLLDGKLHAAEDEVEAQTFQQVLDQAGEKVSKNVLQESGTTPSSTDSPKNEEIVSQVASAPAPYSYDIETGGIDAGQYHYREASGSGVAATKEADAQLLEDLLISMLMEPSRS